MSWQAQNSDGSVNASTQRLLTSSGSTSTNPTQVAMPTATPAAGSYTGSQSVALSTGTPGATIYYTTDGSTPTTSSPVYSTPIGFSTNKTIKAIAVKSGLTDSDPLSAAYTVAVGPLMIVACGESNSGGFADNANLTTLEAGARTEVNMFNVNTSTFEPLDIGTNNNLDHSGLNSTTHGWENELANQVAAGELGGHAAYYVQTGQGASKISDWAVGGSFWNKFLARTNAAKALITNETFVVWMSLGINDAIAGSPLSNAAYKAGTEEIIGRIKTQLPGCKIFICKLPPVNATYDGYSTQIDAIDAADADVTAIGVSGLTMRDTNHWDYAGMKTLTDRLIAGVQSQLGIVSSAPSWTVSAGDGSASGNTITFTASGNAITQQLPCTEPFSVIAEFNSGNQATVVAISQSNVQDDWGGNPGSPDKYPFGFYHFNGNLYTANVSGGSSNRGAISLPCWVRGRRSGFDAIIESSSDSGATWSTITTVTNAFNDTNYVDSPPATTCYIKAIAAAGAATIVVRKV